MSPEEYKKAKELSSRVSALGKPSLRKVEVVEKRIYLGEPGKDGKPGPQGEKGDKGDRGDRGFPGQDGKDGRDFLDVDPKAVADKLNTLSGAIDGKVIKNFSTKEENLAYIKSLKGNDRIDISNIRNGEQLAAQAAKASGGFNMNDQRWHGGGSSSGGSGTVTSVSVVSANGVSGSVANSTTTPAITLALGAIAPTSVAASGAVSGSNLSGTNTGDQDLFSRFIVSGQSDVVVSSATTALTLVAGSSIGITTNNTTKTITISYTGSGGSGGGTPGGADTQVQFNDSGSFGGDSGLTYDKTLNALTLTRSGGVDSSSVLVGDTGGIGYCFVIAADPTDYLSGSATKSYQEFLTGGSSAEWQAIVPGGSNFDFYGDAASAYLSAFTASGKEIFLNTGGNSYIRTTGSFGLRTGAGSQDGIINMASISTSSKTFTFPNQTATVSTVTSGTLPPATTPVALGQIFVNTASAKVYISTGIASSADWSIMN